MSKRKPYRDAQGRFAKRPAPKKKRVTRKAPARKAPARKAPARKAPAKKTPARKAPARKAPAKKAPARKAPAPAVRPSVKPKLLRPGTELELTATTKGGTPKGKGGAGVRDPRVLHLKIRVIVQRPMTAQTALALLDRVASGERGGSGVRVEGIDWAKGRARGEASGDDVARFYGAIRRGESRLEVVE